MLPYNESDTVLQRLSLEHQVPLSAMQNTNNNEVMKEMMQKLQLEMKMQNSVKDLEKEMEVAKILFTLPLTPRNFHTPL